MEGRWPSFTQAVCGSAGKSRKIKVDVFVANMMRYIADESIETAKKQIDEFGSHRFLRDPEMEPRQWSTLQLLDSRMLKYATMSVRESANAQAVGSFH